MALKKFNPTSAGRRFMTVLTFDEITKTTPEKSLTEPKKRTGGRNSYDAHARKSCYLIGVSMLRCGSEYRSFYDAERERLASERPGWTAKRSHLAALRKMEKAFLRDLWVQWRKAVNLPIVRPYHPRINN